MGLEEKLPSGVLLTTVEGVAGYMRKASFWPATFGQVQHTKLGVNRANEVAELETAALRALPTSEMKGLLR